MNVRNQPAPRHLKPSRSVSLPSPSVWLSAMLFAPALLSAQQPAASATSPAAAQQGVISLRGLVADPDDAEIPGATITLAPASGKAVTTTSGGDGTYTLLGVPPGTYTLTVTMPGFAAFVRQGVRITAGTPLTLNAKMAIQNAEQVVNVTSDQVAVSVDPGSNASATVLSGKDLDALSDDPDELSSELTALAGPSSGPSGGQIYIDGFTGGQLPPKSSIREIRINQNPFSAQYDRPGFGRIEIFTKPGTDKFHGSAQLNDQNKLFNTGSPFINNSTQPGYNTLFFLGSLTGPINRAASFSVGGSYRDIQSDTIVNPPALYATSQTSGVFCLPGTPGCNVYATQNGNGYSFGQFTPQTRFDISPRIDLALGEKNTLTVRFQYEHNNQQEQGLGGTDLPQNGYGTVSGETTVQVSDTQILTDKIINETRFEYQRPTSTITPYSTAPEIMVQGAFTAGGSPSGASQDTQNHVEVQNYTSVALAKHFIRLGGRLRYTGENNTSTAQSNGTFSYNSINSYLQSTPGCASTTCTGSLSDFTITAIQFPTVYTNTADVGLYAEDDWKIKPTWTFSYGIRYEAQNYIHDKDDWAPRLSTAYGIGKKTVLRAGAGLFYDRFFINNQLSTVRNNGINQQQYTLSSRNATATTIGGCNPSNPFGGAAAPYGCGIANGASRLTIQNIANNFRAPYTAQENVGIDQQLFRNGTLSVNYQYIRGVHQFQSDAPNYNISSAPLDYQFQSNGVFTQKQLIANLNVRNFHGVTFGGFYSLNFAKSDTSGITSFASVPNDLAADYGRASFDVRNRIFLYGNITLPHLISVSPLIAYQSGSPYNITSGLDLYADNQFNSRAVFVPAGTPSTVTQGFVKSIAGCGTFATPGNAGGTGQVPINYCTGPGAFTTNLRIVKTFGFGPQSGPRPDRQQQGGGQRGPGGAGGPGGGGGGRGGGGGGFGGGGASSGKRYNASFGIQGQNIFNDADRGTPNGTLSSPSFGVSTTLAGTGNNGLYTTGSAIRRVYLQASFSF